MGSAALRGISVSLLFALLIAVTPGRALCDYDPNGEHWDSWIAGDPNGGNPWLDRGTATFTMTSPTTGTLSWDGNEADGNSLSETNTITGWTYLPGGWAKVTFQEQGGGSTFDEIWAISENVYVSADRAPEDGNELGLLLGLRKAKNVYSSGDAVGSYGYLSHYFGAGWSGMSKGTVAMTGDGNFTADFRDANDGNPVQHTGTWALDSGASQMGIAPKDGNNFSFDLGKGLTMAHFSAEQYPGGVGYEVVTKLGSGRTLSDLGNRTWMIQGLITDGNGIPVTVWGTLAIDGNTFSLTFDSSTGGGTELVAGSVDLDPNGIVSFTDSVGEKIMAGYLNLRGDVMILGHYDEDASGNPQEMGLLFAVPEPAAMGLLAAGGCVLLRCRRKKRQTNARS